jgi:hypothetical protein
LLAFSLGCGCSGSFGFRAAASSARLTGARRRVSAAGIRGAAEMHRAGTFCIALERAASWRELSAPLLNELQDAFIVRRQRLSGLHHSFCVRRRAGTVCNAPFASVSVVGASGGVVFSFCTVVWAPDGISSWGGTVFSRPGMVSDAREVMQNAKDTVSDDKAMVQGVPVRGRTPPVCCRGLGKCGCAPGFP